MDISLSGSDSVNNIQLLGAALCLDFNWFRG